MKTRIYATPAVKGLRAGFPTVPEMPACRPDEFYADQHVIGHIRLLSSWQIS